MSTSRRAVDALPKMRRAPPSSSRGTEARR
jgi:hypothetical protein